jgi:hypothetical protein
VGGGGSSSSRYQQQHDSNRVFTAAWQYQRARSSSSSSNSSSSSSSHNDCAGLLLPAFHCNLPCTCRILGKIGGVPALGPGMGAVLPALPKGQILKATASPAAIEIHYSKAENKDAA